MAHILETSTSTDIEQFMRGMRDAQTGVLFDFWENAFWKEGHIAGLQIEFSRFVRDLNRDAKSSAAQIRDRGQQ